ncbi:MAG: flagellar basal body rod protein FlgC [Ruegeria sp.]
MSDFSHSLTASASALRAQASRLRHVSENISNADTPGYRRKTVPFETIEHGGKEMVQAGRVKLDRRDLSRIYEPGHPMADETGHYRGSNVDLMIEIADAREAQRSYEANLKMFDQTRQMSSSLMDLLRK